MPPNDIYVIARRIFLVQRHVAHQTAASINRLQQIVAENSVFRETPGQRALECIDLVNSFADKGAFLKRS